MDQTVIATALRQSAYFLAQAQRISQCVARAPPQQPQRHRRADDVDVVYVPGLTSRPIEGGSAIDGNILRRTITMGEP